MSRKVEMNVVSAGWTQMELVLLFYGWEACDPAHYWGPGVRDSYIVHYVHEGHGTVYMGDREYPLGEGQGFLILPDTVIHYEADAEEPWTYSWFGFRGVQAKAFMQRAQLSEEHPVFTAHDKNMMALYDEMLQAGTSSVAGGDVLHQSLLYRLMAALIASSPIKEEENPLLSTKETYIRQAVQFMENRYSQRTSILDIAQAVGLDRTYLSGLFKERYGKSLQAFFLEYRMNRAAELLRNPMLSVSEVAHSVGYTDPALFPKCSNV